MHHLSMLVEQFDLNLLPAEARSIQSVEFAQAATEFIEAQFSCVGKKAMVRVAEGCIEVECEANDGDRSFAFRLIANYRDGWLPGRAILLRLWFSSYD